MKNVMLDLETLSTKPNAVIASIGAVVFDKTTIIDEFYQVLSLSQQEGRHIAFGTVEWWIHENLFCLAALTPHVKTEVGLALTKFSDFCLKDSDINQVMMWGNGADFDNVLLRDLYEWWKKVDDNFFKLAVPWRYYNNRCFRTLKNLDPAMANNAMSAVPKQTQYNALDDALWQAKVAQKLLPEEYWL